MAEAAGSALRGLLDEGEVTIYNIGPDKYQGRVVADDELKRDIGGDKQVPVRCMSGQMQPDPARAFPHPHRHLLDL